MEIVIANEQARNHAIARIRELPIEPAHVVKLARYSKKRTKEQNGHQWAGMLGDFSKQGILNGRRFDEDAWHYYLKREFLPDYPEEGITLKGYKKWTESPDGELVLVGSTTKLTTKGFAEYIERCHAYGAGELGIRFTVVGYDGYQ